MDLYQVVTDRIIKKLIERGKSMRKCRTCFRYTENEDDAKAKGITPIYCVGYKRYFRKPRPGVRTRCMKKNYHEAIDGNARACKYHKYRWSRNLESWWIWTVKYETRRWYERNIRVPIGGKRPPVPLEFGFCPHCGEMPYSDKQCVFCGQRFTDE